MIGTATRGHSSNGARAKKKDPEARRYNPSVREGESAYTLTFEAGVFRSLKALAALRGQNVREFFRQLVADEMERAVKRGEMTNAQLERPLRDPTSR